MYPPITNSCALLTLSLSHAPLRLPDFVAGVSALGDDNLEAKFFNQRD
jgi:hypothetical protein